MTKKELNAEYVLAMEASYKKKLTANRSFLLGAKYYVALEALEFGRALHNGSRKDGSPEFIHQLTMAQFTFNMLDFLVYPEPTLAVIYLHDVPEDKDIPHGTILNQFGEIIATPVFLMDKNRQGPQSLSPEEYHDGLWDNLITSAVKPVDRSHNLATMFHAFTKAKQIEYVQETEKHVLRMLNKAFHKNPRQANFYGIMHHTLRLQIDMLKNALKMG